MSTAARSLPLLRDAGRLRLETRRMHGAVPVLPLRASRPAVRLRRAEPIDVAAIHALLQQHVTDGVMLPRTTEQIARVIRDFVVAEEEGVLVGCGSLRIYDEHLAEIGALAVAASVQGKGVGRRVVETLVADARALGIARVFALTMQVEFFTRLAFEPVPVTEFPAKVAGDCAACARRTECRETAVSRWI